MSFKIDVKTKGLPANVDSWKVPIKCPKCNSVIEVSLSQIEKEETIRCNTCGTRINLKDKNKSVQKGTEDVQHALDDLERTLKRMGAKFG